MDKRRACACQESRLKWIIQVKQIIDSAFYSAAMKGGKKNGPFKSVQPIAKRLREGVESKTDSDDSSDPTKSPAVKRKCRNGIDLPAPGNSTWSDSYAADVHGKREGHVNI